MEMKERKNPRLQGFDYSSNGAYFVTICTYERKKLLSAIRRDDPCGRPYPVLSDFGVIARDQIKSIEEVYGISVTDSVIMPDHIHMVIFLPERNAEHERITLGRIIGAYKSVVSNKYLALSKDRRMWMGKLWQGRYYEHVVRNETDLREIREYIQGNPDRWWEKQNDR